MPRSDELPCKEVEFEIVLQHRSYDRFEPRVHVNDAMVEPELPAMHTEELATSGVRMGKKRRDCVRRTTSPPNESPARVDE